MNSLLRQSVIALSTTSIAIAILAAFIYLKGRKKTVYWTFALYSLSTALWSGGEAYSISTTSKELGLLWWRINHIGVIFIPVFFVHFVYSLLELNNRRRNIVKAVYIFALIFSILDATKLLILEVVPKPPFNYFINPGVIYPLFFFLWLSLAIHGLVELFKAYFKSTGARRNQLKYLTWGTLVGYIGGAPNFLPTFNNFQIPFLMPYGTYGIPIYVLVATYAIVKLRLMDVNLAWRYLLSYFVYTLASIVIFVPLIIVFKPSYLTTFFIVFCSFLVGPYFSRHLIKFFQLLFFGKKYRYWNSLKGFWDNQQDVYTSSQLFDVLERIPAIMEIKSYSFFMFDRDRALFVPFAFAGLDGVFDPNQAQALNTIYSDDPLPVYLTKEKRIIIRDELLGHADKDNQQIIVQMNSIRAQVSVPLFVAGRLTAILNLGPKKNQEMYHQQDMELLNEVVQLAQKHLSHISFFESSIFFSGSVAHDIRKPFNQGIISDYLDNICKGLDDPASAACAKEAMANLKNCLANVHNMSEDMMSAFKNLEIFLKSGFKPQKIDYTQKAVLESASFKTLAQNKGLAFEMILPKESLFVYAEPTSVQRILNELLTNAVKYTDKGKITVKVSQGGPKEILTEVIDTGCGIPEEDQEAIWELFKRGKNGQTKEGAGIGLAMVRQLVEANAGKIWLDSTKGKGSSFFFTLPAWEEKKGR